MAKYYPHKIGDIDNHQDLLKVNTQATDEVVAPTAAELVARRIDEVIPTGPGAKLYHGTRSSNFESFIDADGNLTLRASENLEGKTTGISFSDSQVVARDYASRVLDKGPLRSGAQGAVFEIDADAIPAELLFRESGEEIATRGPDFIVIPKGKFRIIKDVPAQKRLRVWEEQQKKRVRALTDEELVNEYGALIDATEFSEWSTFGMASTPQAAKPTPGISEDIVAKYSNVNPASFPVFDEMIERVMKSDDPQIAINRLAMKLQETTSGMSYGNTRNDLAKILRESIDYSKIPRITPAVQNIASGNTPMFHGSGYWKTDPEGNIKLDYALANNNSEWGPGFYLSERKEVARMYSVNPRQTGGVQGQPRVEQFTLNLKKVFDIDAVADPHMLDNLMRDSNRTIDIMTDNGNTDVDKKLISIIDGTYQGNITNRDLYRILELLNGRNRKAVNDFLRSAEYGYDSITHVGDTRYIRAQEGSRVIVVLEDIPEAIQTIIRQDGKIIETQKRTIEIDPKTGEITGGEPYDAGSGGNNGSDNVINDIWPVPEQPAGRIIGDTDSMEKLIKNMTKADHFRRIAQWPGMKQFLGRFNPGSVANDPAKQVQIARKAARFQAKNVTRIAMAKLRSMGPQKKFFSVDEKGLIDGGPFREEYPDGLTLNTIRTYPSRYRDKMQEHADYMGIPLQKLRDWLNTFVALEDDIPRYLLENGVDVHQLSFNEGGRWSGRVVMGKIDPVTREMIEVGFVGRDPRMGSTPGYLKTRIFETQEEAIEAGFVYLQDIDALEHNIRSGLYKVIDIRSSDYILDKVDWRTTKTPEGVRISLYAMKAQKSRAQKAVKALHRAMRGETIPTGTVKMIERLYPQIKGKLRDLTKTHIEDIFEASRTLSKPDVVLAVPKVAELRQIQKLLAEAHARLAEETVPGLRTLRQREISALNSRIGFIKYRMGLGEPFVLPKNPTKALRGESNKELKEVVDAIQGVRVWDAKTKKWRYVGGLIDDLSKGIREEEAKLKIINHRYQTAHIGEYRAPISGAEFAGKIFEGPEGKAFVESLAKDLEIRNPGWFKKGVLNFNAVSRYFMLAADPSLATIQLVILAGYNPRAYVKALGAFVRAMRDSEYHDRIIDENKDLLQKYSGKFILTKSGQSDFTEALAKGGILHTLPFISRATPLLLEPWQRGFEAAMDKAGIEILKSLDHKGLTPEDIADIGDFANAMRGVADSSALGVDAATREAESLLTLAPRYNRGVIAYIGMLIQGGLKGYEARWALLKGLGALMMGATAFSLMRGESAEDIVDHLTPGHPHFWTWVVGDQLVGPGSKYRSIINLIAKSWQNKTSLFDFSMGFGDLDYIKNPLIRFARGQTSPAVGLAWDLSSNRDFMGDPTRDGLLSLTETISKRFMPIYVGSLAWEEGSFADRGTLASYDFIGLRGHSRNRLWELSNRYKDIHNEYESIPADLRDLKDGQMSREQARRDSPFNEALWFIRGTEGISSFQDWSITKNKVTPAMDLAASLIINNQIDPMEINSIAKRIEDKAKDAAAGITSTPISIDILLLLIEDKKQKIEETNRRLQTGGTSEQGAPEAPPEAPPENKRQKLKELLKQFPTPTPVGAAP